MHQTHTACLIIEMNVVAFDPPSGPLLGYHLHCRMRLQSFHCTSLPPSRLLLIVLVIQEIVWVQEWVTLKILSLCTNCPFIQFIILTSNLFNMILFHPNIKKVAFVFTDNIYLSVQFSDHATTGDKSRLLLLFKYEFIIPHSQLLFAGKPND